ncbi:hypothetical protein JYT44_02270 [Caldithrix abyssi]|nr:hypothetical protein [Caldithrix abyssi]
MPTTCPICGYYVKYDSPYFEEEINSEAHQIVCYRCGLFRIKTETRIDIGDSLAGNYLYASGWIQENQKCLIQDVDIKRFLELKPPSVGERATKLLQYITKIIWQIGSTFSYNRVHNLIQALNSKEFPNVKGFKDEETLQLIPLISISWSLNWHELEYLLRKYLWEEKKYIDITSSNDIMITPKGWAYLESLKYTNPDSQIGFIAMWFDKSLNSLFMEIEKGIKTAGYKPKRVDRHEHINRIDDEIISLIRQSRFIVADYTGQRGGVYFESGFALGIGIPVIWICREDEKEKLHFNTNHYNFIFWNVGMEHDLGIALERRILAVSGKGTIDYNSTE